MSSAPCSSARNWDTNIHVKWILKFINASETESETCISNMRDRKRGFVHKRRVL